MQLHNPVTRAAGLRNVMLKAKGAKRQFFIAKIAGSGQEAKPARIFHDYFRWRDYIKNPDWLAAAKDEVWSPKFLGLAAGFPKLADQYPCYPAAQAMAVNDDPRAWNRVFTVQVAGCDYACVWCYVPKKLNQAQEAWGKYFTAKEIVDEFLAAREQHAKRMNVLRLSGGEVALVPELVVDVVAELKKRELDKEVYVWIDCNLSFPKWIRAIRKKFGEAIKSPNVGIVGCFKAANEEDFALTTGAESKFYAKTFLTAQLLLSLGADLYLYLPATVPGSEKEVLIKLRRFAERIAELNKNLPLRLQLQRILDYPATSENRRLAAQEGRVLECDQKAVHEIWYKRILPHMYKPRWLTKYVSQVPL